MLNAGIYVFSFMFGGDTYETMLEKSALSNMSRALAL
jgi:hypothetical protein